MTGYVLALVDFDTDTSAEKRRSEPTQHGLFPSRSTGERNTARRATAVFVGDALRIAAHLACRVTAVAAALSVTGGAASAARWLVPAWFALEFVVFNLARWLEADSWRYILRGADGFAVSALFNFVYYLVIFSAPLLWLRMPCFACPHIWAGGTVAALLSNAALLAAALHLAGDDALATFPAFEVLGACAGAEALGCLLVWTNMVKRYRRTLWRRCTMHHFMQTLWEDCTLAEWGDTLSRGWIPPPAQSSTRNASRAIQLVVHANRYWPREALVKAWLREQWVAIQAEAANFVDPMHPDATLEANTEEGPQGWWVGIFPPGWLPEETTPDDDHSQQ